MSAKLSASNVIGEGVTSVDSSSRGWMGLAMTRAAMRKRTMDLNCMVNNRRILDGGLLALKIQVLGLFSSAFLLLTENKLQEL